MRRATRLIHDSPWPVIFQFISGQHERGLGKGHRFLRFYLLALPSGSIEFFFSTTFHFVGHLILFFFLSNRNSGSIFFIQRNRVLSGIKSSVSFSPSTTTSVSVTSEWYRVFGLFVLFSAMYQVLAGELSFRLARPRPRS